MTSTTEQKSKGGRPARWTNIDRQQVEKLASIGCTVAEIGEVYGVSSATISRRFATNITKGRGQLKVRLRQAQFKAAEKGNSTMLVWLGKQMLDQRDKFDFTTETKPKPMAVIGFDFATLDKPKAGTQPIALPAGNNTKQQGGE